MTTLNDAFGTELAQEDKGYKSGSESFNDPPLSAEHWESTMCPWWKTYPLMLQTFVNLQQLHSNMQSPHLAATEVTASPTANWSSPVWMMRVLWGPVNSAATISVPMIDIMTPSYPPLPWTPFLTSALDDDTTSSKENFPTAPLDEDVWSEDPILDRHLCIHKTPDEPNHQCSYPCPFRSTTFRMGLPQSTAWNEAAFCYDPVDFSDISSDLPDIMTTTSDNDIPNLVDVSDAVWFA